jgi:hypothetical protein
MYLQRYNTAKSELEHYYARLAPQTMNCSLKVKQLQVAMQLHLTNYRRIADLMNAQRPLLRKLRKENHATIYYNASNNCVQITAIADTLSWNKIQEQHTNYVFEVTVLKDTGLVNPYAKELYAKETGVEQAS